MESRRARVLGRRVGGFSDFFAEIFGRGHGARGGMHGPFKDHHAAILLDLEDAFAGVERQISLQAPKGTPAAVFRSRRARSM